MTGDGRADAVVVNADTLTVRVSSGGPGFGFFPNTDWTHGPYYGGVGSGVHFADVNGDHRADAIVANADPVKVRPSDGFQFLGNQDWTHGAYCGTRGTFFADVNGDQRADAVVVNDDTVTVRPSDGIRFLGNEDWIQRDYWGSLNAFVGGERWDPVFLN